MLRNYFQTSTVLSTAALSRTNSACLKNGRYIVTNLVNKLGLKLFYCVDLFTYFDVFLAFVSSVKQYR